MTHLIRNAPAESALAGAASDPAVAGRPATRRRASRPRLLAVTAAAVTLVLAACGSGADTAVRENAGGGADIAYEESYDAGASAADGAAGTSFPGPVAPGGVSGEPRSIIQTGYLYLSASDPVGSAAVIVDIVESAGGRVESQSIITEAENRHPSADLTTRIPAEDLTGTLAAIGEVGEVVSSELMAEDVTAQVVDLDARISAKEMSIERLEELLASARTNADIIAAEETLTQRQTELEQLLTSRKGYSDAVEMATISIHVAVPTNVPVQTPPGFGGGLSNGWAALVVAAQAALVAIGFALPWLVLAGVVLAVIWLIRRARANTVPAAAVSSPAPAQATVGSAGAAPTPAVAGEEPVAMPEAVTSVSEAEPAPSAAQVESEPKPAPQANLESEPEPEPKPEPKANPGD